RAEIERDRGADNDLQGGRFVDVRLLDVGEDLEGPAAGLRLSHRRRAAHDRGPARRDPAVAVRVLVATPAGAEPIRVVVRLEGYADLFEVVLALGVGGALAHLLDGGQEQADEHGDDGDHYQQLDQRERRATPWARRRGVSDHEAARSFLIPTGFARMPPPPAPA